MSDSQAYLIVNADDYGYFRCVSCGILEAATQGIVTATGVIANVDDLAALAPALRDCPGLDAGVHLNLTAGTPLTPAMRENCARWGGTFPGKFAMVGAVLSGAVRMQDVEHEWQAQIERCLAVGLKLTFLNSHEHIHMLPSLFGIATALAHHYGIAHVRYTGVERPAHWSASALLRSAIVASLQAANAWRARPPAPRLLGLEPSGRLDESYLQRVVPRLRRGIVYELMCHPGRLDGAEVKDPRLLAYHDWEGELATLTRPSVRELLQRCGVRLIRYHDLQVRDGRLVPIARAAEVA